MGRTRLFLAKEFGVTVDAITISQEQFNAASQRVREQDLNEQVQILLRDYRDLSGTWDRIVSIEMIEAVGKEYYDTYFSRPQRHLAADGLALIQAIIMPDHRYAEATKRVDFIKACVFPGCCIPSLGALGSSAARAGLQMHQFHDHTIDYAKTLAAWWNKCQEWTDKPQRLSQDSGVYGNSI